MESGETKSKRNEKEYWNSQVDRDALVQMSDDMFSVCLCKHVKAVLHACSSAPKWSKHLITYITMKFKQLKKKHFLFIFNDLCSHGLVSYLQACITL